MGSTELGEGVDGPLVGLPFPAPGRPEECLAGGGEMGALMRSHDWARTPTGPVASWPQSLRTAVSIMLESRFPMVIAWGPDFRFFYNDGYRPILGGKHPAALGTPGAEIFPEVWDVVGPEFERVRRGESFAVDDWLLPLDRNGYVENCWFTLSYSPIRDETGGVGGLLAVVVETTRRVESERRLLTLRELARRAADAKSPEAACRNAGGVLGQNPTDVPFALFYLTDGRTARRVCSIGLAPDHPAAAESVELGGPGDAADWPLARAAAGGELLLVEGLPGRFQDLPGGSCPEPVHTAVVVPLSRPLLEHPYGFLVAGVSPRRAFDERYRQFFDLAADHVVTAIGNARAYEEERRRAEALAEIDRAKTAFFSNVSHEFRTPLTLMAGPLEEVLSGSDEPVGPRTRASLEVVQRNCRRLQKLVNTLLDFARIEAGRAQASYEPVDLAALTAELASTFRSAVERAGLALAVDCPPLPEPVHVDRQMWEKIVLNLLSNALKFTFEGRIAVSLAWQGDRVELVVSDTGVGIPAASISRLFERFYRVPGMRSRTLEGSGIGLALVQELARMHGGEVAVSSEPGRGTAFTVTLKTGTAHLPRERVRAPSALESTAVDAEAYVQESLLWLAAGPASGPGRSGGERAGAAAIPRILVADDNADMREYLQRLLASRWTVETVADGAAALERVRAEPPDLVLADVMMPGLDGFQLLQALRADQTTKLIPYVMLSARAGEEARIEGLEAGVDDYLVKPFGARELIARVGSQLALSRMRRQEEAQRSELYQLFQQAPAPICVLKGRDLVFEMANPLYHRVAGRTELVGRRLLETIPEVEVYAELLRNVMRTGAPYVGHEMPVRFDRRGDGILEDTYWTFVYAPLAGADGAVDRVMAFCNEVTDQVVARQKAEAASRAKDEFLATLSHELRSPLNAIVGWTQILKANADADAETLNRALETIHRNAMIQSQLIGDILDVQRLTSGKMRLNLCDADLARVIEAALETVRPAAQAKSISLVPILDSGDCIVAGDPDRLQQVIWNLLSNAIKFTPRGGRVQVRLMRINSHVEISVEDNGPGIEPELIPYVFERFRQGDSSSTRRHSGVGLGLAIVRSLVELHGGTVEAANRTTGSGAAFVVKLPRTSVASALPGAVSTQRRNPTVEREVWLDTAPALHQLKVLVVDDQPDAREVVARVLGHCGADVVVAKTCAEAMDLIGRERPDVIVCDIEMPGEDGYAFIRRVRQLSAAEGGRTPAAALTAYAGAEDRMRALAAGFQIHLPKPVQPAELATVVASLADRLRQ